MNTTSRRLQHFASVPSNRGSLGVDLVAWQADLAKHWPSLRFGSATVQQQGEQYLFQVQVFFEDMNPEAVRVELYAEGEKDAAPGHSTDDSWRTAWLARQAASHIPRLSQPIARRADYTPRLIPQHVGALVPLEAPFILWYDAPSWR